MDGVRTLHLPNTLKQLTFRFVIVSMEIQKIKLQVNDNIATEVNLKQEVVKENLIIIKCSNFLGERTIHVNEAGI